jgi:hypothetical protein
VTAPAPALTPDLRVDSNGHLKVPRFWPTELGSHSACQTDFVAGITSSRPSGNESPSNVLAAA